MIDKANFVRLTVFNQLTKCYLPIISPILRLLSSFEPIFTTSKYNIENLISVIFGGKQGIGRMRNCSNWLTIAFDST